MSSLNNEEDSLLSNVPQKQRDDARSDIRVSNVDSPMLSASRCLMTTVNRDPEPHPAHQRLVFTDPVAFRFARDVA